MRRFGSILGKGRGVDRVSGLFFLLLAVLPGAAFMGCAVEAGNPVAEDEPDDDRQPDPVPVPQPLGLVSLQLDVDGSLVNPDKKGSIFSDFRLNLRSITFVPDEMSGEPEVLDITGDLQTPGLFASGVEFAPQYDGLQLPPRRYTEIVLGFAAETAGALLVQGGNSVPVRLGSGMADTLRIPVDLQLGAEEPLAVVVAFDGDGSLKPESDGAYRFEPRGSVVQAGSRKLFSGITDFPGAQVACAYSYALGNGSLLRRLQGVVGGIQNA